MAAAAALEGPDSELGFPNVDFFCVSETGFDGAAAPCAAEARMQRSPESGSADQETTHRKRTEEGFIDEEASLNMPSLVVDMAGREMLVIKSA